MVHLHNLQTPLREVDGLSLHKIENVAVIVMNRGQNKINDDFINAMNTLLDEVESNESYAGLITTGVGKFYSTGMDLEWLVGLSKEEMNSFIANLWKFLRRFMTFPVPTIAAINGHSFAGGAFMAFAHDLRTMKDSGKGWICFNEVHINLRFRKPMIEFLREKLGWSTNLHNALVLGHRFTAPEAFTAGWVHTLIPESHLITDSVPMIKKCHGNQGIPRESLVNMKKDVYESLLKLINTAVSDEVSFNIPKSKL